MATYVQEGASVECKKSLVVLRKVTKPILVKIDCIDGSSLQLYKYKSSIRALVSISEELNPRNSLICPTSKLIFQDQLEGEVISIYAAKRIKFELTSNFSHVHGIQGNNVNAFTYARIDLPWRMVLGRHIPQAV